MTAPVDGTVYFNVNASFAQHSDGHWRAITVETGIVTYGATQAEAEEANREANLALVRSWKRRGMQALDRFMREHGIRYRVRHDDRSGQLAPEWHGGFLPLAA